MSESLTVWELFEQLYRGIAERFSAVELVLSAFAEVANDNDWHRSRSGSMTYEKLALFSVGEQAWVIGYGLPNGYPANGFGGDLLLLPLLFPFASALAKESEQRQIQHAVMKSTYFKNSPLYALADGRLASPDHFQNVIGTIGGRIRQHVDQMPQYDSEFIFLDGNPITRKTTLYRAEIIPLLLEQLLAYVQTTSAIKTTSYP